MFYYTYIAVFSSIIQKQKLLFPVFILLYKFTLLFFPNECPGLLCRHFIWETLHLEFLKSASSVHDLMIFRNIWQSDFWKIFCERIAIQILFSTSYTYM